MFCDLWRDTDLTPSTISPCCHVVKHHCCILLSKSCSSILTEQPRGHEGVQKHCCTADCCATAAQQSYIVQASHTLYISEATKKDKKARREKQETAYTSDSNTETDLSQQGCESISPVTVKNLHASSSTQQQISRLCSSAAPTTLHPSARLFRFP